MQLDFLLSMIRGALSLDQIFLSQTIIKTLNHHAIACLHFYAGQYRPCAVNVSNVNPPSHIQFPTLMDDHFVNSVNRYWNKLDAFLLSAYVLWRLNVIHPFINGHGRTARVCCYFVFCLRIETLPKTKEILPNLLIKR